MARRLLTLVIVAAALASTAGCSDSFTSTHFATSTSVGIPVTPAAAAPTSAKAAPARSAPAVAVARTYRYYPQEQIYFCEDREIYFWTNSFGAWSTGAALPTRAMIGDELDYETVRLHVDDPTLVHASFARAFPASGTNRTHSQTQAIVTVTAPDWDQ